MSGNTNTINYTEAHQYTDEEIVEFIKTDIKNWLNDKERNPKPILLQTGRHDNKNRVLWVCELMDKVFSFTYPDINGDGVDSVTNVYEYAIMQNSDLKFLTQIY
ncbi:MAG: hypothetical protein RSC93_00225 [Erysipelotrichaceae bacterium]